METTQQNTVRGSATIPERSETAFHAHHSNASERQVCAPLGANFMILRSRGGGFLKNQLRDRFQNSNQFLSAAGNRILDFLLKVPLVFLRKAHSWSWSSIGYKNRESVRTPWSRDVSFSKILLELFFCLFVCNICYPNITYKKVEEKLYKFLRVPWVWNLNKFSIWVVEA